MMEKLKDELSVGLSINHGQYQTTIDRLEYKIDSTVRQIEDLVEKTGKKLKRFVWLSICKRGRWKNWEVFFL